MQVRYEQQPGDIYVGNLCAPLHQVGHFKPEDTGPLYK